MKRILFVLLILLLVGCGDEVPHDRGSADDLIGNAYVGNATSYTGQGRAFSLLLDENGQGELTYKLAMSYLSQSTQPTVRSGGWYSDGKTLTLLVEEQDGEPTEQPPITFEMKGLILTAVDYDTSRFDFEPFIMSGENVD